MSCFTLCIMVERRLTVLAVIVLLWGAAYSQESDLAADRPAPGLRQEGALHSGNGGRDSRAARHHLRPRRAPARHEPGLAHGLHQSHEGATWAWRSDPARAFLHLDRAELYRENQAAADAHRGYLVVKRNISPEESTRTCCNLKTASTGSCSRTKASATIPTALSPRTCWARWISRRTATPASKRRSKGTARRPRQDPPAHRRESPRHRPADHDPAKPGHLPDAHHRRAHAVRGGAGNRRGRCRHNAASGSVVVMRPDTGDILAMASYPTFDPNVPRGARREPQAAHEPRLRRALRAGLGVQGDHALGGDRDHHPAARKPDQLQRRHAHTLQPHDSRFPRAARAWSRWPRVLAKSSNIGAIQVGLRVGQVNMHDYMVRFGFGQQDRAAAARRIAGQGAQAGAWGKTSLASVSMGQEVSVTTLQLAQAASVVANGGLLVKPRLVLKRSDQAEPPCAAGPRPQAGDRHHHAPDDGRRGAARHRQPGALAGYTQRRQDRLGADLRLRQPSTTPTPTTAPSWALRR